MAAPSPPRKPRPTKRHATAGRRPLLASTFGALVVGCAQIAGLNGFTSLSSEGNGGAGPDGTSGSGGTSASTGQSGSTASGTGMSIDGGAIGGSGSGGGDGPGPGGNGGEGGSGGASGGNGGNSSASGTGGQAAGNGGEGGNGGGGDAGSGGSAGTGGTAGSGGSPPEFGTVEFSGTNCAVPNLPTLSEFDTEPAHPDPFLSLNDSRITQKSQWTCRRAEILQQIYKYEMGEKPAVPRAEVTGRWTNNVLGVVVDSASEGTEVEFTLTINLPAGSPAEPVPLVIGLGGIKVDQAAFTDKGVATASLITEPIASEVEVNRGTGLFYDLYGSDHPAGALIAWAWAVSRIIDALEKTPAANIDPTRIAVTGCSRGGKGALLAGALDERIVLTIPQQSGAGGVASWRVSQADFDAGAAVQTLSEAATLGLFRSSFGSEFGSAVDRLPFDHHMVMGLVAPRALLVLDAELEYNGIDSSFTSGTIAHTIWEALGVPDAMAYWQSSNVASCTFPSTQRPILDAFIDKFLVGGGTENTNVVRADNATADLATWMPWTVPTLD